MRRKFCVALSVLISICMALSGCSDSGGAQNTTYETEPVTSAGAEAPSVQTEGSQRLILAIRSNDSLSPYACTSMENQQLSTLMYEPLVVIGKDFSPVYELAESVEVDGTLVKITLRDGARFSDGSYVTASDVVYSYKLAAKDTRYKNALAPIKSCYASNGYAYMELSAADIYFASNLDFPIIKSNSDEDGKTPVGSGRYVFTVSDDSYSLQKNEHYNGAHSNCPDTIYLSNTPDAESLQHSLQNGKISVNYTDFSDGTLPRFSGKSIHVPLNNIVYLGINSYSGPLASAAVRQVISNAIDRETLIEKGFFSNGTVATGPMNPAFYGIDSDYSSELYTLDYDKTVAKLNELGYNDNEDPLSTLSLQILVNADNSLKVNCARLIADSLENAGIAVTVNEQPYKKYCEAIEEGNYDIYLGEVRIDNNMDIAALVTPGGELTAAMWPELNIDDYLKKFRAGTIDYTSFAAEFNSQMPFIPLAYRYGVLSYSDVVTGTPEPSWSDIYFNLENWFI